MAEQPFRTQAQGSWPDRQSKLALRIQQVVGRSCLIPISVEFLFDPAAPITVSVTFRPNLAPPSTWHIARELLYRGLFESSGTGDVRVWPSSTSASGVVHLLLNRDEGSALFQMGGGSLRRWLEDTYEWVGSDEELATVDWDAVVEQLLNGA
ncbi:SsgA family sporulation/cell division regulator [Streptomyces nigra]|uniref:SsgA family sporulation/cell division regulator n=1 Tax=Streptomyces nigra TaxID=1827580 RepID=UPI0036A7FCBB